MWDSEPFAPACLPQLKRLAGGHYHLVPIAQHRSRENDIADRVILRLRDPAGGWKVPSSAGRLERLAQLANHRGIKSHHGESIHAFEPIDEPVEKFEAASRRGERRL